jgi:hypothetical protein
VTVFERDATIDTRPRDWTILIHWAMPTLAKLLPDDMQIDLSQANVDPFLEHTEEVETLPAYNGTTGDVLFTLKSPGGRRISRRRLRKVLLEGLDIQWGKMVTQLAPTDSADTLQILFEDGEQHEADYVVAADGIRSQVREVLLGAEAAQPVNTGLTIAMACFKHSDQEKARYLRRLHPLATMVFLTNGVGGVGSTLVFNLYP